MDDDLLGEAPPKKQPAPSNDLDDLLGGGGKPPPPAQQKAAPPADDDLLGGGGGGGSGAAKSNEIDDLLGDSTNNNNPSLDDDLLFGDVPQTTPAASPPATSKQTSASVPASTAPLEEQPKPRNRTSAINIPLLTDVPPSLVAFVPSSGCFFIRFVSSIARNNQRERNVIILTDSQLYVMNEEQRPLRSIPINMVLGIITQSIHVQRRFGQSKETELHVIVQVEGDKDYFFSFAKDDANGNTTEMLDFLNVVSALSMAYGISLPISKLTENERIQDMVKWNAADDRLRKQLTEALAFRTEVMAELSAARQQESQLDVSIAQIRNSSSGQAAMDIKTEIEQLEKAITTLQERNSQLLQEKALKKLELQNIQTEMHAEEHKRAEAVKNTMEKAVSEQLQQQAVEFELMKAAHKREMDKIAMLTSVYERRAKRQDKYAGASQLSLRIDELEDDLAFVTERLAERQEQHNKRVKAMSEAKKRSIQGKDWSKKLDAEIEVIKITPQDKDLPPYILLGEVPPVIKPVDIGVAAAAEEPTPTTAPPTQPQPQAASQPKAPPTRGTDSETEHSSCQATYQHRR